MSHDPPDIQYVHPPEPEPPEAIWRARRIEAEVREIAVFARLGLLFLVILTFLVGVDLACR